MVNKKKRKTRQQSQPNAITGEVAGFIRQSRSLSPEERLVMRRSLGADDGVARAQAIAHFERMFRTTGNPLWFWRAYQCYRDVEAALPEWILQELDAISSKLLHAGYISRFHHEGGIIRYAIEWPKNWKAELLEAFGFKTNSGGGEQSPFPSWERSLADQWTATCVRVKKADGHNETDAVYLVASEHGLAETTVRRAWKKYQTLVCARDLGQQRDQVRRISEGASPPPST